MIVKLDTDLIFPIAIAISAILFTIGCQTLELKSGVETRTESLRIELAQSYITESAALREVDAITKALKKYQTTSEELESLGASHTQATDIIKSSEALNIDPKN